jgi:hypothetical protein
LTSSDNGTSSAVPADLRAYSQAAMQIDDQIHQLALRLGRVLDAYRATKPEYGPNGTLRPRHSIPEEHRWSVNDPNVGPASGWVRGPGRPLGAERP